MVDAALVVQGLVGAGAVAGGNDSNDEACVPLAVAAQVDRVVRRGLVLGEFGWFSDNLPVTYLCRTLAISV